MIIMNMMILLIEMIFMLLMMMISVSFLTLGERKILGYIQDRKGPNKLGFMGLLQSFSDAIKLLFKEWFFFQYSYMFFISPMLMLIMSMLLWLLYPWLYNLYNLNYNIILFIMFLGISVLPLMMIGWISCCNYSMLGVIRSVAQMISFEIGLFLLIYNLMMMIENFNFMNFFYYQYYMKFMIFLYPLYLMFFLIVLIELNRTPFDLIEGESELVSGFNTEYYSVMFMMIFLSEYMNIMFMSLILVIMFFGYLYWSMMFMIMYLFHMMLIIWIRGVLPRIRYDMLMNMCWTDLLMSLLLYLLIIYLFKEINLYII